MAILLLSPLPPMLFMGEEFGSETPFLFFCDFEKDLARAVTEGRRNEFARFARFNDPTQRERIPDPNAVTTFESSRLDWGKLDRPPHQEWLSFYRKLLELRRKHIVPHVSSDEQVKADYKTSGERVLTAHWQFAGEDHSHLYLLANLGESAARVNFPAGQIVYASEEVKDQTNSENLPPWSVVWVLNS
jgi:maltooligosyltrehalose trehalohydrolase